MRIVHLEDDAVDAELVRRALANHGIVAEIVIVDNRKDYVAALAAGPTDAILCDYNLPSFDGVAALALAREKHLDVPVIFVSGTIGEDRAVEVLRSGATDYVLKSRLEKLPFALRRALDERQERRRLREAERMLQLSEERFQLTLRATNDTLYDWDIAKETVWWNENLAKTFAYPAAKIGNTFQWWEGRIHPADHDRILSSVQEAIDGRLATWSGEYRFRRGDGTYADVLDRGTLIYRGSGRPVRWVGSMMDVSPMRSLQQQFLQAQKMEVVGRLAGGVAHDFNNLLTAIIGFSELALAGTDPGDPARANLEEVLTAGKRGAGLTRQLLSFTRRQITQTTTFDLNELVVGLEKMLDRLVGENVRIAFNPEAESVLITADPVQIEQVIINLVVNARDAMSCGGKISIETAHEGDGRRVLLSVTDNGTGMSAEVRAHLFEPFFTTKEQGKGTGLGLATVFGIVERTGGTIEVDSELGRGTTFRIRFPRSEAPAADEKPRAITGGEGTTGETILLAEDDQALHRLTRSVLERAGYRVLAARDGTEALRLAEAHAGPLHLLITDMVMPSMSGAELARIITRDHAETRVLFMSGYTEHGWEAASPGANFIQKPFTPNDLKAKVRSVLAVRAGGKA